MNQELIAKIEKNWDLFYGLVKRVENKTVRDSLLSLCDSEKDRLAAAPASSRTEFNGAYPGGLVRHSLTVFALAKNLNKSLNFTENGDSLLVTSLFHDFGKIGNENEDYYLEQESNWHRERGMMYELNKKIDKIHPSQRSLWWLTNKAKCPVSEDEMYAILSLSKLGQMYSTDLYDVSPLSVILQTAVRVACIKGKNKQSVLE